MDPLETQQKLVLLGLARRAMERWVAGRERRFEETGDAALKVLAGAFVTLRRGEELRGCIGRIQADRLLERVVQEMAMSSATSDPRFPPLQVPEISQIDMEISVLSPFRWVEDISQIQVGRDGLIIREGMQSGLLLPQVAEEYGWDVETFLAHTCLKAGLPQDYWRLGKAELKAFSAVVFSEKELGVR